ncbi:MAG: hypothetical protein NXH88_05815 [Hyphomonas sp.]|nr:hypothetical protein [Hyphomonas sp.]
MMTKPLTINVLPEPTVSFYNYAEDVDGRRGLAENKPADYNGNQQLKIGFVGLQEDIDAARSWFAKLAQFHPAYESNASRYRDWPGFKDALGVELDLDDRYVRPIADEAYRTRFPRAQNGPVFDELVQVFDDKVASLLGDDSPQCIVVCIPNELGDLRVSNPGLSAEERALLETLRAEEESDQLALFQPSPDELKAAEALYSMADDLLFRTFYRALKARVMTHDDAVPIQVLRRETIEKGNDTGQSHATRAWNIAVSLYYKSKGTPWLPTALPKDVCFVGVSFHHMKRRSGHLVYASVAQAYSRDVEPFALKGANIDHNQRRDRQIFLNAEQAEALLRDVAENYEKRAGVAPTRIVLHKTTQYQPEELEGFDNAAKDIAPFLDLIWVRSTAFRMVRRGNFEPWRGTLCSFDKHTYLYTSGYVPWWNQYPGPHIPAPLEIGSPRDTDMETRAKEILALTKMNWNSSDALGAYPITLLFARRVGELMAELGEDDLPNPSYRFYV